MTPEDLRTEVAECLMTVAIEFISPEKRLHPSTLDIFGELDSALEHYRRTGDPARIGRPMRQCHEIGVES